MNDKAFTFQTLHPDTIMDALFEQGIRVDSGLTPLNSYENRVWQFQDEDRRRFVVKFYRPQRWSAEQINEEHQFALELQADGVPVAAPVVFNNQTLLSHQGFFFAVFPSVGGRQFEPDNLDQMEWVGRYLGRLHQTGRKKNFVARPGIGVKEYLLEPRHVFENTSLIPSSLKGELLAAVDKLIDAVMGLWHNRFTPLRLHGDCHAGNILWRDGPLFVDLDDARNGPAVQDLWMLLHGDNAERRMQLDIILEAYEEFSTFDTAELAFIEPLRAMRMVYYLAWLIRRWDDPAFPVNFPWLAEEDSWRNQIKMFLEQARVLQEPPLQLTPMY
ncbi:serine/threonine protein kinase [[Enterobacter] lignolyticus]|uniref:Stress response kinase A n=1 Tax=Enterobacter lignolyticus (strain SCF1) TaxID=701347 RepID=E3G5M0_ENTLS|nr:serine/threonine protein kinase [[Enterobacter] lignolyticus]ADO50623.1 aminoglycoside phosphotransferase [[Enterobacter] lignolyticus SCF1]